MTQEIGELTDSVPWKWWGPVSETRRATRRQKVVDLFHYLISLPQVLELSRNGVFESLVKKNGVNFQRRESGCAVKNRHDSRRL